MHPYQSKDGLLSSSDPEAVAAWDKFAVETANRCRTWRNRLYAEHNVRLIHPDDGWVRRNPDGSGSIRPSYPSLDLHPEVGDLIALGSDYGGVEEYRPGDDDGAEYAADGFRLVRVTDVEKGGGILDLAPRYHFEDTGIRLPEPAVKPRRRWWRRG